MASLTELSFNWTGFISAMISNIAFTYRSIYSKKAMVRSFRSSYVIKLTYETNMKFNVDAKIFKILVCNASIKTFSYKKLFVTDGNGQH